MKITKDGHHMIITNVFGGRKYWKYLGLGTLVIPLYYAINSAIMHKFNIILLLVILGYWIVVVLLIEFFMTFVIPYVPNKIVFDKFKEKITVEKRFLYVITIRRTIPFARVASGSMWPIRDKQPYELSLVYGIPGVGIKEVRIVKDEEQQNLVNLLREICDFIGK